MKINTLQGGKIIRLIKKMGIKDELVKNISKLSASDKKYKKLQSKLLTKCIEKYGEEFSELDKEDKTIKTVEVLNENIDIAKELGEIEQTQETIGFDIAFSVIESAFNKDCEKDLHDILSGLFDKKIKDIQEQEFNETANQIMQIIKSETFAKLFTLATH